MADKRKGLGTGLGVLLGENFQESNQKDGVTVLPISKVEPRQDQPRSAFDEEALQELADSISRYGVIQPITVRKTDSGFYQIIAGERRWRASRMAGLEEVPVRIIEADDRRTAEIALVENLQREDLNPIEEAQGYQTLIDVYGLTQDETAKSVGKSRPAVTNSMRLLALEPRVSELVMNGKLSAGHARALLAITDADVQYEAANEVVNKGLSVRKTEQLTSKMSKNTKKQNDQGKNDCEFSVDYASEEGLNLTKALARKCRIIEGKRTGKIEIEYYSSDDRETLLNNLYKMGENWKKL